jgi:hypothetical protein
MPVLHLDLSVKNPHGVGAIAHRRPEEILEEIAALDAESAEVLESRSFPVRTCYIIISRVSAFHNGSVVK